MEWEQGSVLNRQADRPTDRPTDMRTQAQTLTNNSNVSKTADNLRGAVGDAGNSVMRKVEVFRTGAHPNHRVEGVGICATKSVRSQQAQVGAANLTEWSPIRIQNYGTQTKHKHSKSDHDTHLCSAANTHAAATRRDAFPSTHDLICNS